MRGEEEIKWKNRGEKREDERERWEREGERSR